LILKTVDIFPGHINLKVKNLQYYLQLDYPVELRRISSDEGGGFNAAIPLLGKYAFSGDGETVQEALDSLEEVKAALFTKYLLGKMPIPEPKKRQRASTVANS